jgi:hypothetical protein
VFQQANGKALSLNLKPDLQSDLELSDITLHDGAALVDYLEPVHVTDSFGQNFSS